LLVNLLAKLDTSLSRKCCDWNHLPSQHVKARELPAAGGEPTETQRHQQRQQRIKFSDGERREIKEKGFEQRQKSSNKKK